MVAAVLPVRDEFFGPWSTESEACAEFDRRIFASGLFQHNFPEVEGYYLAHRPNREQKGARIDRILIPGPRLRDAGWATAIGVEIKASGTKLGRPLSQAIDYTYVAFRVGANYWHLNNVFLWPLEPQKGTIESVMVQNGIGCIYEQSNSPLVFQLERQVIRLRDSGELTVNGTVAGTKVGSR